MSIRLLAAAAALAATASAFAQANAFTFVNADGKTIGKGSYSIDKVKDGFHIRTRFEYKLLRTFTTDDTADSKAAAPPAEAQINADYKVDANGNYISGYMQNGADQMMTSFTPSKTRDAVVINQIQGGVSLGSRTLPMPRTDFTVVADFDPAAIQVLLTAVANHPSSTHLYLMVVPSSNPRLGNSAAEVSIADPTDATGTLDGKPIALKHYALKWVKGSGDLYADTTGTLMQIDAGNLKASYIRNKFSLAK